MEGEVLDARAAGYPDRAIATLRQMADFAPDHPWPYELAVRIHASPPRFGEAEALIESFGQQGPGLSFGRATILYYQDSYDAALAVLFPVLDEYRRRGSRGGQAATLRLIGNCHGWKHDWVEAETTLEEAADLFRKLGDEPSFASSLNQSAWVARLTSRYEFSTTLLERAIAIQSRIGDRRGEARSWYSLAYTRKLDKDEPRALEALDRAAMLQRRIGDARDLFQTINEVAQTYLYFGQGDRAVAPLVESAAIAASFEAWGKEAANRQLAALEYSRMGRHAEALEQSDQAVQAAERSGDARTIAGTEVNAALILSQAGQYHAAMNRAQAAAELASRVDPAALGLQARALMTRVQSLVCLGRLTEALTDQRRALELFRQAESLGDVVTASNNLAGIHSRLGHHAAALRSVEDGLKLARERARRWPDDRATRQQLAVALTSRGVVIADLGRFEEALANQLEARELWDSLGETGLSAIARMNLASLRFEMRRTPEAIEDITDAINRFRALRDERGEAAALVHHAEILLASNRREDARRSAVEAVRLTSEHGWPQESAAAHTISGQVQEAVGEYERALESYRKAIETLEHQRGALPDDLLKMRFFSKLLDTFERAVRLQAQLEHPTDRSLPAAFRLAEQARARGLTELLAETLTPGASDTDGARRAIELADRVSAAMVRLSEATTLESIATARATLEQAEDERERFLVESRSKPSRGFSTSHTDAIDLARLQHDVLREDETLLRYFFGNGAPWLWIVDRREVQFVELQATKDEIASRVAEWLHREGRQGAGLGASPSGETQADSLGVEIGLSEARLSRRLIVVPDGPLHRIPFEAVRRDGKYLIENHEIVVVPSATVLAQLRSRRGAAESGGFLGAGDPHDGRADSHFPDLAFSGQSVERIASRFPPGRATLLLRDAFTKENLRRQRWDRFRFAHFATHGWLDDEQPGRVGLRLSPSAVGGPAEFLNLEDVAAMDLDAELVVLSACQTGLGKSLPGEGVAGWARTFLAAGAQSVMVSLWNVGDRTTAEFMETFYQELDGRSVPEAAREAKLAFLRSERPARRAPYAWAPFVLVGNPGIMAVRLNPGAAMAKSESNAHR